MGLATVANGAQCAPNPVDGAFDASWLIRSARGFDPTSTVFLKTFPQVTGVVICEAESQLTRI